MDIYVLMIDTHVAGVFSEREPAIKVAEEVMSIRYNGSYYRQGDNFFKSETQNRAELAVVKRTLDVLHHDIVGDEKRYKERYG